MSSWAPLPALLDGERLEPEDIPALGFWPRAVIEEETDRVPIAPNDWHGITRPRSAQEARRAALG